MDQPKAADERPRVRTPFLICREHSWRNEDEDEDENEDRNPGGNTE
jgi:hypothetical protein